MDEQLALAPAGGLAGGLFEEVENRVTLAGSNKMEILIFNLGGDEVFGINVFKVREVCRLNKVTWTPNRPPGVVGIASLRGKVIPVLDMAYFVAGHSNSPDEAKILMVAEYNNHVIGFMVNGIRKIERVAWERVHAPENLLSQGGKLVTAVTELEGGVLVSIVDVEQILALAFGEDVVGDVGMVESGQDYCVFFVDDSAVARKKIRETLDKMGVKHIHTSNGREAWEKLQSMAQAATGAGNELSGQVQVILVDAEMPEMDGYVLTQNIKSDRNFAGIPVVMHSSLSSDANRAMGKSVGVDYYVPKFDAGMLAETLRPLFKKKQTGGQHG